MVSAGFERSTRSHDGAIQNGASHRLGDGLRADGEVAVPAPHPQGEARLRLRPAPRPPVRRRATSCRRAAARARELHRAGGESRSTEGASSTPKTVAIAARARSSAAVSPGGTSIHTRSPAELARQRSPMPRSRCPRLRLSASRKEGRFLPLMRISGDLMSMRRGESGAGFGAAIPGSRPASAGGVGKSLLHGGGGGDACRLSRLESDGTRTRRTSRMKQPRSGTIPASGGEP